MSEDEAINTLQLIKQAVTKVDFKDETKTQITRAIETILDLYQQEKEWTQKIIKTEKFYRELYNDVVKKTDERYIPKDKIRAKIKELENKKEYCLTIWVQDEIRDLKELLED